MSSIYNIFNMTTLQETFPYLDWHEYVNWNLKNTTLVYENETIIVSDVKYLHGLKKLLETTPKRTIANYIGMGLTLFSSAYLNDVLYQRRQQYKQETTGALKSDPRLTDCIERTGGLYVFQAVQRALNTPTC